MLFSTMRRANRPFTELWEHISGRPGAFDAEEELARRQILNRSFSGQLEGTVRSLYVIAQSELTTRDISWSAIRRCLTEILAHFPVYRIYARVEQAALADLNFLSRAVERAKKTCLPVDVWLVEKLGCVACRTENACRQRPIAKRRARSFSAIERAALRESSRGYRLLSLWPPHLAK